MFFNIFVAGIDVKKKSFLDIDKTVVSLDHVIGYHHVAHDVDSIMRQG